MKHLMTLLALVVAVTAGAQGTAIHEYPWNPDWDNDNFVGSSDLTGFLSAFGSEFGNPPEPCDYDGTPFEEWWGQVFSGDITIDSIFIELQLVDSAVVFSPGCPDPTLEVVEYVFAEWMTTTEMGTTPFGQPSLLVFGHGLSFYFAFDGSSGVYLVYTHFSQLTALGFTGDGLFGGNPSTWVPNASTLPFPEGWFLDEDGIHLESGWTENHWPYYANYLHILPYWHYSE